MAAPYKPAALHACMCISGRSQTGKSPMCIIVYHGLSMHDDIIYAVILMIDVGLGVCM